MPKSKFGLKESDEMIQGLVVERLKQYKDLKELMESNLLGNEDNVPAGYQRIEETGEITRDEEM